MTARPFPDRASLTICFAHVAYRLGERFAARNTGMRAIEVRNLDDLSARIPETDVLVVSGLWRNELIERAARLRFIQSIGAAHSRDDAARSGRARQPAAAPLARHDLRSRPARG